MRRLDKDISYLDNNHTKEQGKNKAWQTLITKSNRETICNMKRLNYCVSEWYLEENR